MALSPFSKPSRRSILLAIAAGSGTALTGCGPAVDDAGTPRRIAREIDTLMRSLALSELTHDPELATRLGLSEAQVGYAFKYGLNDRSQSGFERRRLSRMEAREALLRAPRPADGSQQSRDLAAIRSAYSTMERLSVYGHGQTSLGAAMPYVADHLSGAYRDIPDLLLRHHVIRTKEDAEAYLGRLNGLGPALDDERRRLFADADAGIIPPDFILSKMETLAARLGTGPADTHPLTQTLESLVSGLGALSGDEAGSLVDAARQTVRTQVLPAYTAYRAALNALALKAPETAGIWHLPSGDAYYADIFQAYTYQGADPQILHQEGVSAVVALTSELDTALSALGRIEGSVAQRLRTLASEPDQRFITDDDTPETRAEAILARLNAAAEVGRSSLGQWIDTDDITSTEPVILTRSPEHIGPFAPPAVYTPAPADGRAPARVELNLTDPDDWPSYTLPTLAFHETLPGHHVESLHAHSAAGRPLIRQLMWNTAYGEGWATYAEDLADEAGAFDASPLARIGYLQSLLLRATRLVTDTGLHALRWPRQQAFDYMFAVSGLRDDAIIRELDQYTVRPGHAAAYWVGRQRIRDLRERAKKVMGPDLDLKTFHRIILEGGPRPLSLMESDIEAWYIAERAKSGIDPAN